MHAVVPLARRGFCHLEPPFKYSVNMPTWISNDLLIVESRNHLPSLPFAVSVDTSKTDGFVVHQGWHQWPVSRPPWALHYS
jgi:hypothetical protein